MLQTLLTLVFPAECETCHAVLNGRGALGVCPRCESQITLLEAPRDREAFHFDRAYGCALYEGKMKELLHAYKFSRRKTLKNFFAKMMRDFLQKRLPGERFDCVTAVPMDAERERARGFSPARLLAAALAKDLGIPEASRQLRCVRKQRPQSLLAKHERETNVKDSFAAEAGSFLAKHTLLIDDILTTGHTASECAGALKAAGAASVTVLTCARGA